MGNKRVKSDFAINGGIPLFSEVKTTMNLPAPSYNDFIESVVEYEDDDKDPVEDLENKLAKFHKAKHVICFSSCFTAMALTLKLLALRGKSEVIIPSLTYRRMSDIILWAGLTPCFCDNDSMTLGVNADVIKRHINKNTAVILAPHPIVNFSDINEIMNLGKEKGIPVMFDSVEAMAGEYQGMPIGSFGIAESFSLHPSKLMNACEGGYITTSSDDVYLSLLSMREGGLIEYDGKKVRGHVSAMSRYHAIMGICSLDIVHETINENFQKYCIYRDLLKKVKGIKLVEYNEIEKRNFKSILIEVTDDFRINRNELHDLLNSENILARKYYYPAQSLTQKKKSENCLEQYLVAEKLQEIFLLLPFGYSTSENDIRIICNTIMEINSIYNEK